MPDSSQLPLLPLMLTAAAAGLTSGGALLAYSVFSPRCQVWAPVVRSLPQMDAVALTFDDGPHPEFTPRILDHLAGVGAKATFFVIGRFARQQPQILQRMCREGHLVANHSLDHEHFGVNRNRAYWDRQINQTQQIVADITGKLPVMFRPPMGFKTWHIAAAAQAAKLPVVGWSVRAYDTKVVPYHELSRRLGRRTTGHDIVLLHDGVDPHRARKPGNRATQQHTVDALPAYLAAIRLKNLQIVSLVDALVAGAKAHAEMSDRIRARAAT